MRSISNRSKFRGRRKVIASDQRIITWAKKQQQKSINQSISTYRTPLVCPLIGCDGTGHVNGTDLKHVTLSGCPLYHNVPFEKWAEMRAREEGLVSPVQLSSRTDNSTLSPSKSGKSIQTNQLRTSIREPSLEELATPMEVYQFRCAQQRLVIDKEREAKHHLSLCARIASQQTGANNYLELCRINRSSSSSSATDSTADKTGSALEQHIRTVVFGDWLIEPTCLSAYPADLACLPIIYVCEFCLSPMRCEVSYDRHLEVCSWQFPPGTEIYRKDQLSFFEVDGDSYPDYCRDLCLLTKLFLKHKTVHEIDRVPSFLFYILTENDQNGCHIIGYFSKQKPEDPNETSSNSGVYNNLSCILTMPQHQCQGYGRMLIEMSYVLSLLENRIGSPEHPLSDQGLLLYRKYWKWEILNYLSDYTEKKINIRTMSQDLGIAIPDIVSTLLDMKMLRYFRTQYYIVNNKVEVSRLLSTIKPPDPSKRIDRTCLQWEPRISTLQRKVT